ncbi:xanthine dehydrogenase YagT iron-sulfur-binding subunit [Robbsia andropogonis]
MSNDITRRHHAGTAVSRTPLGPHAESRQGGADTHRHAPLSDAPPEASGDDHQPTLTRRSFMTWVSVSGVAVSHLAHADTMHVDAPLPSEPDIATHTQAEAPVGDNAVPVRFTLNGKDTALKLDPRTTLLDCVRESLSLTGTKKGCDHGQCGACTIHVNGRRVNACLSLAVAHDGDTITTIEGLGEPGRLHPMQQAFLDHDGYQCGYCTSGQIMSGAALLNEPCGASDGAVREAMSGNLCRCGAYKNIVSAVQSVRIMRKA